MKNIRDYKTEIISDDLQKNIAYFKEIFKKDSIIRFKNIKIRNSKNIDCTLVYFDGMVDSEQLNNAVIRPLFQNEPENCSVSIAEYIETQVLYVRDAKRTNNVAKILSGILYGEALLLIDKSPEAVLVDTKGFKTRGISEPQEERILKGPREGFEEAGMFNLAMLRRKLKTPDFAVEALNVGRRTDTFVFICYLDSLADKKIVKELKKRIEKIDIDGILDSNYISEIINENKLSLFNTIGSTERPDIVAARLLEGRIAVVVDGTPVVLTLPYLFSENFQSDEDYYINFWLSSLGRILRYFCFFLSLLSPAVYIALTMHHTSLIPTSLSIAIEKLRGGVPVSPFSECIIMLFVFEILREAGLRMPQGLGHALSVVGGIVVGQAAVEARIISTPMLIVIALSAISGLMLPRLSSSVFYLRFLLVFAGGIFGFYGIIASVSIIILHIISLRSITVDYTLSLRKATMQSLKDTFWRLPWFYQKKRPDLSENKVRQKGERQ